MEVSHAKEVFQAKSEKQKVLCYNSVSAWISIFLKGGYVAFKAEVVTKQHLCLLL